MRGTCLAVFLFGLGWTSCALAQEAVCISPPNPKYLVFRNHPLALVSASEHYGS
jgi:hypothetical protein